MAKELEGKVRRDGDTRRGAPQSGEAPALRPWSPTGPGACTYRPYRTIPGTRFWGRDGAEKKGKWPLSWRVKFRGTEKPVGGRHRSASPSRLGPGAHTWLTPRTKTCPRLWRRDGAATKKEGDHGARVKSSDGLINPSGGRPGRRGPVLGTCSMYAPSPPYPPPHGPRFLGRVGTGKKKEGVHVAGG